MCVCVFEGVVFSSLVGNLQGELISTKYMRRKPSAFSTCDKKDSRSFILSLPSWQIACKMKAEFHSPYPSLPWTPKPFSCTRRGSPNCLRGKESIFLKFCYFSVLFFFPTASLYSFQKAFHDKLSRMLWKWTGKRKEKEETELEIWTEYQHKQLAVWEENVTQAIN